MKFFDRWRKRVAIENSEIENSGLSDRIESRLSEAEDPFDEPVELEIRDVIDLHSIPPRQVKAVVEEYLLQAHSRGFRHVRIIHGKGIGVQREAVRKILERTPFVLGYNDAPPEAGGLGATLAELNLNYVDPA